DGSFYWVQNQAHNTGLGYLQRKGRVTDRTDRFTDWWNPYLTTLENSFGNEADNASAKHVAEVLEQMVRSYATSSVHLFETIHTQTFANNGGSDTYTWGI